MPPPWPQWIPMPMKSVRALARAAVPDGAAFEALASFHSGEPAPNTWVMSPKAPVPVFSRMALAVETPPQSQPARVNGTHGAGVVFCPSVTMFGSGSRVPVESSTRSVQYLKELVDVGAPVGVKYM